MDRLALGSKCTCSGCGGRFYDLQKSPAICPMCGTEQPLPPPRAIRPPRNAFGTKSPTRQPPRVVEDAEEQVNEAEADEEEEDDVPDIGDDVEIDPDFEETPEHNAAEDK